MLFGRGVVWWWFGAHWCLSLVVVHILENKGNQLVDKSNKRTKKTYSRRLGGCCVDMLRLRPLAVLVGMGVGVGVLVASSDRVVVDSGGGDELAV